MWNLTSSGNGFRISHNKRCRVVTGDRMSPFFMCLIDMPCLYINIAYIKLIDYSDVLEVFCG